MPLHNLIAPGGAGANSASRDEILARYKHVRAVGLDLNSKLVARLSKDVMHEGGKKLGILRKGVLFFNSEDESSVLMDYCIYDVRRNGRNAIDQYLLDTPPDPESDEMVCLRSMRQAIYSVFIIESVQRGFGVTVRDLLSDEDIFVADIGFGNTAQPGLVFASRLLYHDGFAMTGGAALPVGMPPEQQRQAVTELIVKAVSLDDDRYFDPAPIIRACLSDGSSSRVEYRDPLARPAGRSQVGLQRAAESIRDPKVGRNAPCPCGSGKKYKNCCMRNLLLEP